MILRAIDLQVHPNACELALARYRLRHEAYAAQMRGFLGGERASQAVHSRSMWGRCLPIRIIGGNIAERNSRMSVIELRQFFWQWRGNVFSELVVCYLFLGGAGAGACFVLSVMGILVPRDRLSKGSLHIINISWEYRKLFGFGFALALAALVAGVLCLFADLGRADRVFLLLSSPKAVHITIGAYALIFCVLGATLQALIWTRLIQKGSASILRLLGILTAVLSLVVMTYTGLLLQSLRSVPLWHSIWLPVLFTLSSLSCGAGLVIGSSLLAGLGGVFGSALRRVAAFDELAIALEALSAAAFLLTAFSSASETALLSAKELVLGQNAGLFWVGFALLGLAVPFALEHFFCLRRSIRPSLGLVSAACVLTGGFVMRYCLVQAGVHPGI